MPRNEKEVHMSASLHLFAEAQVESQHNKRRHSAATIYHHIIQTPFNFCLRPRLGTSQLVDLNVRLGLVRKKNEWSRYKTTPQSRSPPVFSHWYFFFDPSRWNAISNPLLLYPLETQNVGTFRRHDHEWCNLLLHEHMNLQAKFSKFKNGFYGLIDVIIIKT